jgi:hypothetical protein
MGDRVGVTLTVPTALVKEARCIIEQCDGGFDDTMECGEFTDLVFVAVNYANLACEQYLTAAGIAWMISWNAGGSFPAGTAWCMFNEDGSPHATEYSDECPEQTLSPFFHLIDKPKELLTALQAKKAEMTSPSWGNQVEYGKRYRAIQLISPTSNA